MTEFERLLNDCKSSVERFVNFKISSKPDAEDVLQDIFLTAFQKFAVLKNKGSFKAWIISIAKNKCNDYYRKSITNPSLSIDELPESMLVESRYGIVEPSYVSETVHSLNCKDEQILKLFYMDGYKQQDISNMLDIPLGTVKSRLHTARENFRSAYLLQNTDIMKGADIMSKIIMPEYLPQYKITKSDKSPFSVKWEELMGWFIVPKLGEKLNWAIYDLPGRKRAEYVEMEVMGKAEVHGITGVFITAKEYEPMECNRTDNAKTAERTFIAQLTDTHCRFLAESHYENGVKKCFTFLDGDDFIPNWGFGEDNCGNETSLAAKGVIHRGDDKITCAKIPEQHDIVGRFTVETNGKQYDTVCVMDIELYNGGTVFEQYIDKNGRTILARRFNHNNWAAAKYKKEWTEMLPNNERILVNGDTYVHWYDCITDYIL